MANSKTVQFHRGTIWAKVDGTIWVLGKDYDRLWSALTEIAQHDSNVYTDEHRRLVRIARDALKDTPT